MAPQSERERWGALVEVQRASTVSSEHALQSAVHDPAVMEARVDAVEEGARPAAN